MKGRSHRRPNRTFTVVSLRPRRTLGPPISHKTFGPTERNPGHQEHLETKVVFTLFDTDVEGDPTPKSGPLDDSCRRVGSRRKIVLLPEVTLLFSFSFRHKVLPRYSLSTVMPTESEAKHSPQYLSPRSSLSVGTLRP